MDTLAAFIKDRCILDTAAVAPATPLYKQYQMWCDDAGEKPETQKMFGMWLSERGFESTQLSRGPHKGRRGWLGIGIRVDDPDPDGSLDFTNGAGTRASEGDDGLPRRLSVDHRLPYKRAAFAGDSPDKGSGVDDGRQKNKNLPQAAPRVEKDLEKRSTSSTSSTESIVETDQNKHPRSLEEAAGGQMQRAKSGPALALKSYLEKPNAQLLEWLTKAVLTALDQDTTDWEAHTAAVKAAAEDPTNHPLDCECGACL
jgi:hypothetical protein